MYLDESGDHSLRVVLQASDFDRNRHGFERSWQNVLTGTRYVGRRERADRVRRLALPTNRAGEEGLELADLVASPIGRHVIGKPPREDWVIVSEKLRRRAGSWRGAGLVVLPQ